MDMQLYYAAFHLGLDILERRASIFLLVLHASVVISFSNAKYDNDFPMLIRCDIFASNYTRDFLISPICDYLGNGEIPLLQFQHATSLHIPVSPAAGPT